MTGGKWSWLPGPLRSCDASIFFFFFFFLRSFSDPKQDQTTCCGVLLHHNNGLHSLSASTQAFTSNGMEGGSKSGSWGGVRAGMEGGMNDILDDNGVEQIRWYRSRMFVFKWQLQRLCSDLWSTPSALWISSKLSDAAGESWALLEITFRDSDEDSRSREIRQRQNMGCKRSYRQGF